MKSNQGHQVVMSIGEIADRFGLATHVLRHWEATGLISPSRDENDRRLYGPGDLYRVAVIQRAKEAGLSLERIRDMVTTRDAAARREIVRRQRADLVKRIARLEASLALLECALDCDHEDFTQCARFQATMAARIGHDLSERDESRVLVSSGSRG